MRRGTASRTAMWVAALRGVAELDEPAIVRDPLAAQLLGWPYGAIIRGMERVPVASRVAMQGLARLTKNLSRHLALRTRAIDDAVAGEARGGSHQLVVLGAGLDARAYRLEALGESVAFEVDHPDTQAHKREAIGHTPALARDVKYVPIDFARDTIMDVLARAGHDASARTTWLWEGVIMYLDEAAIDRTTTAISQLSAPGSCLIATYHDASFGWEAVPLTAFVRAVGEPFRTRFRPKEIRLHLESKGFHVERDEGTAEWSQRYLGEPGYRSGERLVIARTPE